jgi:DNA polymerase III subunit beta
MKFQVLQENLSKALIQCIRFVSPKAQLPVLANILFSAKKGKLLLSATNLEASISIKLGAKVEEEGDISIPAKTISEIVGNLNPGTISFEVAKEQVKITSSNFRSTLSSMNSSDFPTVPDKTGKSAVSIPSNIVTDALSCVLFASSSDETRPVLTGVLIIFQKERIFFVATDGFRLSQKKVSVRTGLDKKLIIPKNSLSEILRLDEEEEIVFDYNEQENQVVFGMGETVFSTRIIQGEFPDFEKIIPKDAKIKVNVDKEEILQAIKLASVFARDSANVIKLIVEKEEIVITSESSQSGSQEAKVDAKIDGFANSTKPFEIAFNYRFLEEFLGSVKSEDIEIQFSDPNAPGVFLDTKDKDYLHLIMPVRIQG